MNATQIKYLRGRVNEIYNSKYKQNNQKRLSEKEQKAKIKSGEYEIQFKYGRAEVFFPKTAAEKREEDAIIKFNSELDKKRQSLLDEIVLGTENDAIKALNEFSKFGD